MAQARIPEPIHAPKERGVRETPKERGIGQNPHPRTPKLVRDVRGNELKDMFEFFPDLPRPPHRAPRVPNRHPRRR
jgi:hypothetical protein